MIYSPPAYNFITFNYNGTVYIPPPYNAIIFDGATSGAIGLLPWLYYFAITPQ